jgi:hypothetical protein
MKLGVIQASAGRVEHAASEQCILLSGVTTPSVVARVI